MESGYKYSAVSCVCVMFHDVDVSRLYAGEYDLPMEWLLLKLYSTHTNFLNFEFESIRRANCPVKSLMQGCIQMDLLIPVYSLLADHVICMTYLELVKKKFE